MSIAAWLFWLLFSESAGEIARTLTARGLSRVLDRDKTPADAENAKPYQAGDDHLTCVICQTTARILTAAERDRVRAVGWRVDRRDQYAYCPLCQSLDPPSDDSILG